MTREEAIDILFGVIQANSEEENEALDMAIEALEQTQWIPCSERLPEKEGEYIACRGNGSIAILHYATIQTMSYPQGFSKVSEETGWSWRQPNVVAWMPRPGKYEWGGEV